MFKSRKHYKPQEPLRHRDHKRPVTRRDFLAQGFSLGVGTLLAPSIFSLLGMPRAVSAALSADITTMRDIECAISVPVDRKIPFICFDLAGGANIAGSNVLVGQRDGQMDFLNTAGYSKLGIPGDMLPNLADPDNPGQDHINTQLGLAFHSKSAMLRGILERAGTATGNINGAIIPARSDNDTGNNPHNPMYGILSAGVDGRLVSLIGSQNSLSGGNSMAPDTMIDEEKRPTKVDRPSDVTGMVDTGDLISLMSQDDAVRVMESMVRISEDKLNYVDTNLGADDAVKKLLVKCGYVRSADLVDQYANPATLDPAADPDIVGAAGIFSVGEFNGDSEFRKTASVMKMVIDGHAGAGTITMGGYDYHTGDRATGELRDLSAGRCIGACLEYAARKGVPLMVYVMSDGSVASNGMIDTSTDGGDKGVWTGDNSSTAASYFLVYNPFGGAPTLLGASAAEQERHRQLGWFRADGSVETAAEITANNVNLLAETIVLNYMALHGEQGDYANPARKLPGLAGFSSSVIDRLTAFAPIVSGTF